MCGNRETPQRPRLPDSGTGYIFFVLNAHGKIYLSLQRIVIISIGLQYDIKRDEVRHHIKRSLTKLSDVCLTAKLFSWRKMSELHRMSHEFQVQTGCVNSHEL